MQPAIIAIGTANPQYQFSQADTLEIVAASLNLKPAKKRILKAIYNATGIDKRHSVLSDYCRTPGHFEFFPNHSEEAFPTTAARMEVYKNNALNLALVAIKNCFGNLQCAEKITHLITVSCTGMYAPGLDIEITQHLNFNGSVKRTAINFMGCYGVFNALKVAESITKAETNALVLVVSVELCTLHLQKNLSLDSLIAGSIFADGAAAALIQAAPKQKKYLTLENFHCDLLPQTKHEMTWDIADYGFDITLSSYVPEIIQSGIADFFKRSPLAKYDLYAIHPGGIKILQACEKALKMSKQDNYYSYEVLRNYGNMSSATILFVLKAIWDDINHNDNNKNIFSCAFGPGLTLESMVLRVNCV